MSLIKCRECGNDVSTEAKTCPKCGVKVKKPMSRTMKWVLGFLGVSVVAGIISSKQQQDAFEQAKANQTPEQKVAEAKRDAQLQWAAMGAMQLKKTMKDPRAFDLTSLYVTKNGHGCYDYRAKNSFGAILPSSAVMTPQGKLLLQEQHGNEFSKTWNRECTQSGGNDIAAAVKRRVLD